LNSSCLTTSPVEPVDKAKPVEYKETDIADVKEAKATIQTNKDKRIDLINKGVERAERFEPLILSLIAYHEYDQPLTLADVSPFIAELPHIASISSYKEKQEFIRLGTEDSISTKKVISEAEKGAEANKYVKQLKAENAELKADIKSRVTEKTVLIGGSFMTIGGIILAVSFFFPAMAKRLMLGGGSIVAVGGCIMAFGSFIDSFRSFMDTNGNKVFWLLLIPLLGLVWLMFIRKADKAIEDMKDDDTNDEAQSN
jgi:hypothetical protein